MAEGQNHLSKKCEYRIVANGSKLTLDRALANIGTPNTVFLLVTCNFVRIVPALQLECFVVATEDVTVKLAVTCCCAAFGGVESIAGGGRPLLFANDAVFIPIAALCNTAISQFDFSACRLFVDSKALQGILIVLAIGSLAATNWIAVLRAGNRLKRIDADSGVEVILAFGRAAISLRKQFLARGVAAKSDANRETAGPFAVVRAVLLQNDKP